MWKACRFAKWSNQCFSLDENLVTVVDMPLSEKRKEKKRKSDGHLVGAISFLIIASSFWGKHPHLLWTPPSWTPSYSQQLKTEEAQFYSLLLLLLLLHSSKTQCHPWCSHLKPGNSRVKQNSVGLEIHFEDSWGFGEKFPSNWW